MVVAILVLHTLALLAQFGGGVLLVIETLRTRKNIATFQSALVEADGLRDKQREEIRQGREKSIRALNSTVHGVRVFDHLPYDNPARKLVDGLIAALSPQNVEPLVSRF